MTKNIDQTILENKISKIKKFKNLYNIPQEIFKNYCPRNLRNFKLKILLINTPCNGFGDIIFLKKLADFLYNTYKFDITLSTTEPEKLKILDVKNFKIAKLSSLGKSRKPVSACRVLTNLKLYDLKTHNLIDTTKFDLFFVAPLAFDFNPDIKTVIKNLVPNANKFNTFFFSEYNDDIYKDFDFHTGIGNNRLGILLENTKITKETDQEIKKIINFNEFGKFALIYVADTDGVEKCIKGFIEMISVKYNKNHKFQIVCPEIVFEILQEKKFKTILSKYWNTIIYMDRNGNTETFENNHKNFRLKNKLVIRGDILPVKNKIMMGLIKNSVKDILLTGDQSITDALSCCVNKNIFYQIAEWKIDFASKLAKLLPNKFLSSNRTSCGTLKAINYNSDYKKFVKEHNFFKNSKHKFDSIFCATKYVIKNPNSDLSKFQNIVNNSKSIKQVLQKIKN